MSQLVRQQSDCNPSDQPASARPAVDLDRELSTGFAANMIRQKAKQLVGHFGYTKSDRPDLEQELQLAILQRVEQFDPQVATWEAFATMIADHRIATIIEERWAEKREYCHNVGSLATMVQDHDGELVELSTQVGEQHLERVTDVEWPHHEAESDLEHDLDAILAKLPPDLSDLCERLKRKSIADVARDLDIPRTNLYRMLEWVREVFEVEGFSTSSAKIPDISPLESVGKQ